MPLSGENQNFIDWRLKNVILLGVAFLFICGAYATSALLEESILQKAGQRHNVSFEGVGYYSEAMSYAAYCVSSWFSLYFMHLFGAKYSMALCALIYAVFLSSFLNAVPWMIYFASIIQGIASATLWNCQANYIAYIADASTTNRFYGLFWSIFQSGQLFGNICQFVVFHHLRSTEDETIRIFVYLLIISEAVGFLLLLCLKNVILKSPDEGEVVPEAEEEQFISEEVGIDDDAATESLLEANVDYKSAWTMFKHSFKLMQTSEILQLMMTFLFMGAQLTFFSGVFGTCVGNNQHFGSASFSYIGLIGTAVAMGEIIGGFGFSSLAKAIGPCGKRVALGLAFLGQITAYLLIFLTTPDDSNQRPSSEATYLPSTLPIALVSAVFCGLADAAFNTIMSVAVCEYYSIQITACVFSIWNSVYSLASAVSFLYSVYLPLSSQLLILSISGCIGTLTFCNVDVARQHDPKYVLLH